jgi:hypothetical protein
MWSWSLVLLVVTFLFSWRVYGFVIRWNDGKLEKWVVGLMGVFGILKYIFNFNLNLNLSFPHLLS